MKLTKKIVIVGKNPPPFYGTSVWFETLKNASWEKELDLAFFDNSINKELKLLGKFSIKKIIQNIKLYYLFHKFIKQQKPDLIFIPISQTTLGFIKDSIFIFVAKQKTKTLLILHGANWLNWLNKSTKFTKFYVKKTIVNTEGIVVLGEKLKYLFADYFETTKIFCVPNGIHVKSNLPIKNENEKFKLIYLGNLQASKGIKILIDSFSLLKNHDLELEVIGNWYDDETKEYCLQKVKFEKLNVNFLGPIYGDKKFEHLQNADLFVFFPLEPEGLPISILEAMSCGLPVIASNQGAISDCVKNGINGVIIEQITPQNIAKEIENIYKNQDLRNKMALQSRELFLKYFTAEIMVQNYSTLFKKIC